MNQDQLYNFTLHL